MKETLGIRKGKRNRPINKEVLAGPPGLGEMPGPPPPGGTPGHEAQGVGQGQAEIAVADGM